MRATQSNQDNVEQVDALIAIWKGETVEFKEASRDFDTDRMGRYVSALCNEANLAGTDSAWLVFGVRNKTREVVGTEYRNNKSALSRPSCNCSTGPSPTSR